MKVCYACKNILPEEDFLKGSKTAICLTCSRKKLKKIKDEKISGSYVNPKSVQARSEKFKLDCTNIHSSVYTYEKVDYKGHNTKVEIFCTKHQGYFWQSPCSHKSGNGCLVCYNSNLKVNGLKRRVTTEELKIRATVVHKDKFTFDNVECNGMLKHVQVTCKIHGDFPTAPHNLLAGWGCPKCKVSGYSTEKPGSLYLLNNGSITKIGITNREVHTRVSEINKTVSKSFGILYEYRNKDGAVAKSIESVLKVFLSSTYKSPSDKFDGYTECFYDVDTQAILKIIKNLVTITEEIQ